MNFLETVKSIIPPSVSKKIADFEVKLDFISPPKSKNYSISKSKKVVTIFVNSLTSSKKKSLKVAIKKSFDGDGISLLIEDTKTELLDKLYKYDDKNDNEILAFFKPPVIAEKDWQALRDSLFLRNEFKRHANVGILKQDIKARFGERGNTISNLCTAGYFENVMMPLYKASKTDFYSYYEIALDRAITAMFVNANMNVEKIGAEIKRILASAKSYGLKSIHIHGIGSKNIENIENCLEKEKSSLIFTDKNIFRDKKLGVIIVEIIL